MSHRLTLVLAIARPFQSQVAQGLLETGTSFRTKHEQYLLGQFQSPVADSPLSVVTPVQRDEWYAVYEASSAAMPTQSPDWAAAVTGSGGYRDVSRLYQFESGERAILPLFTPSFLPGNLAIHYSPPAAWGFGGLVATHELSTAQIRLVFEDLQRQRSAGIQIRPNPLEAVRWREAALAPWDVFPRTAHVLDLEGGFEFVWARRFRSDTRNRVRKAERAGLQIETGSGEKLIREFYRLLEVSFERWARRQREPEMLAKWRGRRRDPLSKFITMAKFAGHAFKLSVARLDSRPIAAILVLQDRSAHYTRGAMIEDLAAQTHANYLLHSRAIEMACKAGCRHYHMGETGDSASLAQFKSRFGAVPVSYAEYRLERLPLSRLQHGAKSVVKRMIGFRDV